MILSQIMNKCYIFIYLFKYNKNNLFTKTTNKYFNMYINLVKRILVVLYKKNFGFEFIIYN